jgi:hypothetical protein
MAVEARASLPDIEPVEAPVSMDDGLSPIEPEVGKGLPVLLVEVTIQLSPKGKPQPTLGRGVYCRTFDLFC